MSVDTTSTRTLPTIGCRGPAEVSALPAERAEALAAVAKALADPVRVQIVNALRAGTCCQCELQPLFDVTQPTLSHHLRKLSDAGVIEVERRGVWAYYSIKPTTLEVLHSWLT